MAPNPMNFIWFGDLHGPKPYAFIRFGDLHDPKPYEFIGFGDLGLDRPLGNRLESRTRVFRWFSWGPPQNARHLGNERLPIQKIHFLTFTKFLAVLNAKINIINPRIRVGIGPQPTISLGKW